MNIQNSAETKCSGKLHGFGKPFRLIFGNQKHSAKSEAYFAENTLNENVVPTTRNDKSNVEIKSAEETEKNSQWSLEPLEITEKVFDDVLKFKEANRPSISSSGGDEESILAENEIKSQNFPGRTAITRSISGKDLANCNGIMQLCIAKMSSYAMRYLERSVNGAKRTKRRSRKTITPICNTNRALMDLDTNCTDMTVSDFGTNEEICSGCITSNCTIEAPFDEEYSVESLKEKHGDRQELLVLVIQELNKLVKERQQLKDKLKMEHMLLKKTRRRLSTVINDKTCKTMRMDLNNHLS